jgi:ketosteroid isomerase-like protein
MTTKIQFIAIPLLATIMAACDGEGVVEHGGPVRVEIVATFLDLLETQDFQGAAELMTDDVVWESRATFTGETADDALSTMAGKEAVLGFFAAISSSFETTRFSRRALFESGEDLVFAELKGDFRTRGTGRPYQNLYMLKIQLDGEQILRVDEYYNPIHAARVLGIDLCAGN